MPTLKVWPASAEAAADEAAALETVPEATDEAEPPQPVRPNAETAAAPRAALRKLRREIMFMVFIAVAPSLERAAVKKTRSTCGTGLFMVTKDPVPVCSSTRTGSKIRFCGATLFALPKPAAGCRAPHGEPTLPCPVTEASVPSYWRTFPFARPSAAHETLPRFRPFALSGLTADALCRFSSASSV